MNNFGWPNFVGLGYALYGILHDEALLPEFTHKVIWMVYTISDTDIKVYKTDSTKISKVILLLDII